MLGSVSEAEDIVQDAYVRWHRSPREDVENPQAFLTRIVTRLCLDHLKSARHVRETYVGPWLPEPVVEAADYAAPSDSDYADDISIALMLALERLSPLERAAFILHDVFDVEFGDVASTLGRSDAACRQLSARARAHLRAARPRFAVSPEDGTRFTRAFLKATQSGDTGDLRGLLAQDVVLHSDGGGRKIAALNLIVGADRVARFYEGIFRKQRENVAPLMPFQLVRLTEINGLPGMITVDPEGTLQTTAIEIRDGLVAAIYVVRNPDKLAHIAG